MATRTFALIIGIAFLVAGVLGFIPGFNQPMHAEAPDLAVDASHGLLLGIFPVNALHNIVHIIVGVLGIWAYRSLARAKPFSKGLAIFYGLLAVMGAVPVLSTTFGLIPIWGHDIWLHAVTALAAAYFGFVHRDVPSRVQRTGTSSPVHG